VTSSQPEGSESPRGFKQLKTQAAAVIAAGRAVKLYSGEVDVAAADSSLADEVDVEDCPRASVAREKRAKALNRSECIETVEDVADEKAF
jgi:hypothetical protein